MLSLQCPHHLFEKTFEETECIAVRGFYEQHRSRKILTFRFDHQGWGTPHNTSRVLLQSWDGFKWEDRNIFDGLGKEAGLEQGWRAFKVCHPKS